MNKSMLSMAVISVMGVASATVNTTASAEPVTGITILDVGSNTKSSGGYSPVRDGVSGAFGFTSTYCNVKTYSNCVSKFSGNAGTGTILGGNVANPTGSFSTGFSFGLPFIPFTNTQPGNTNFSADITNGALTVSDLGIGGQFAGVFNFDLAPDTNFPLEVLWVVARPNPGEYDVALRLGHIITTAEDSTGRFIGQNAQWVLEGCMTTNPGGKCEVAPFPPLLSIVVPGGTSQECTDVGNSTISMNAQIKIHDTDAIESVFWTLDGSPVASGVSVNISVPLGVHDIEATVTTASSQSTTDATTITVRDTIAPVVSPGFINVETGREITTIEKKDKAVPFFGVSDVCDPAPVVVNATVGVPAEKVDLVTAKTSRKDSSVNISIQGSANTVELTVTAEDASGNMSSGEAVLAISGSSSDSDSDSDSGSDSDSN